MNNAQRFAQEYFHLRSHRQFNRNENYAGARFDAAHDKFMTEYI